MITIKKGINNIIKFIRKYIQNVIKYIEKEPFVGLSIIVFIFLIFNKVQECFDDAELTEQGCYFKYLSKPTHADEQDKEVGKWYRDDYGEQHKNAYIDPKACEETRQKEIKDWSGAAAVEMKHIDYQDVVDAKVASGLAESEARAEAEEAKKLAEAELKRQREKEDRDERRKDEELKRQREKEDRDERRKDEELKRQREKEDKEAAAEAEEDIFYDGLFKKSFKKGSKTIMKNMNKKKKKKKKKTNQMMMIYIGGGILILFMMMMMMMMMRSSPRSRGPVPITRGYPQGYRR